MLALWSWFAPRPQRRCFALLDDAGICRGLHQAMEFPTGSRWVQVEELCLAWLDQPLPLSARATPVVGQPKGSRVLAA